MNAKRIGEIIGYIIAYSVIVFVMAVAFILAVDFLTWLIQR